MDVNMSMARQLLGTQADVSRPADTGTIAGLLRALVDRVRAWRRHQRDLHILTHMDARMLKDIGIARGDIERALRVGRFD